MKLMNQSRNSVMAWQLSTVDRMLDALTFYDLHKHSNRKHDSNSRFHQLPDAELTRDRIASHRTIALALANVMNESGGKP